MGSHTDNAIKRNYPIIIQRKMNGDLRGKMSRTKVEKLQKLLPNEAVGIAKSLEGKDAKSDKNLNGRLPLINCECGAEILLLPDLQAMNRAIKAHATEHRKKGRDASRNFTTCSNISQLLSQLSLRKISEQNDT
jgi:hypothetical protein